MVNSMNPSPSHLGAEPSVEQPRDQPDQDAADHLGVGPAQRECPPFAGHLITRRPAGRAVRKGNATVIALG